ncbi:unnamed protein product [Pleuronectes platessa]|uniref:Uncharacterized protein n=1 Tax=Pleuronectes platessa TaxID=8262 RepID=A0A9N7VGD3_PLEPL|nr:unnamed protein product [Pleuronectes platessa]
MAARRGRKAELKADAGVGSSMGGTTVRVRSIPFLPLADSCELNWSEINSKTGPSCLTGDSADSIQALRNAHRVQSGPDQTGFWNMSWSPRISGNEPKVQEI